MSEQTSIARPEQQTEKNNAGDSTIAKGVDLSSSTANADYNAMRARSGSTADAHLPQGFGIDAVAGNPQNQPAKPGEQPTKPGEQPSRAMGDQQPSKAVGDQGDKPTKPGDQAPNLGDVAQPNKEMAERIEQAAQKNDMQALQVIANTLRNTGTPEQINEINQQLAKDNSQLHVEKNGEIGGDIPSGCIKVQPSESTGKNSDDQHIANSVKCGDTTVGLDAEGNPVSFKENGFTLSKHPDGKWYVHNDKEGDDAAWVMVNEKSILFNKQDGMVFFTQDTDMPVDPEDAAARHEMIDPLSHYPYYRLDTDKPVFQKELPPAYNQPQPGPPGWVQGLNTLEDVLQHLPGTQRKPPGPSGVDY